MPIGEFILAHRKKNKITQKDFAKKAGLARSFITRLENDDFEDSVISLATFIRLAKALSIPMHQLFQNVKFFNPNSLPPLGTYLQSARNSGAKRKAPK